MEVLGSLQFYNEGILESQEFGFHDFLLEASKLLSVELHLFLKEDTLFTMVVEEVAEFIIV